MRGFESWNDALGSGAELERGQRLLIRRGYVFDAADIMQPRMLGADAGIVEAGTDRVCLDDLPVIILQKIGAVAVQHAGAPAGQTRGMFAGLDAVPAGLDADQSHGGIIEEWMEQTHRIGAATDAGH